MAVDGGGGTGRGRRPWRVDIQRRDRVPRIVPDAELIRVISATLEAAGAPGPASIGLILADDDTLAELNAAHLGQSGPTDVLSFPLLPAGAFPEHPGAVRPRGSAVIPAFALPPGRRIHLGDIVVSVERAIEQASEGRGGQTGDVRWDAADELRLLVTHGALHICGWDHGEPEEEAAMRRLERALLAAVPRVRRPRVGAPRRADR